MAQGGCALEWLPGGGDTKELLGDADWLATSGSRARCRLSSCCARSAASPDEAVPGLSSVTASLSMQEGVVDAGRSPGIPSSVWAAGTSGDFRRLRSIFTCQQAPGGTDQCVTPRS